MSDVSCEVLGQNLQLFCRPNTGLSIVIPCHNEPDLLGTLKSLWACEPPSCFVEVWVVINGCLANEASVAEQNRRSFEQAVAFAENNALDHIALGILFEPELPRKKAGVGLARRIGMDLAAKRLVQAKLEQVPIVGFDADCRVSNDYLVQLARHFARHPKSPGASLHFEHPLEGSLPAHQYQGIAQYELHLRCYRHGLLAAGLPYAFYTVGSSFAVRAAIYLKQGGMNTRKAGEDFYFIHKVVELGDYTEIGALTVIPEARISDRVPFGTGRMLGLWAAGDAKSGLTYDVQCYRDMAQLSASVRCLYEDSSYQVDGGWSVALGQFLEQQGFLGALAEIKGNTSTYSAFERRFYRWFNGFRAMKFANFAREHYYPALHPSRAAELLADWQRSYWQGLAIECQLPDGGRDSQTWLRYFRALDRSLAQ